MACYGTCGEEKEENKGPIPFLRVLFLHTWRAIRDIVWFLAIPGLETILLTLILYIVSYNEWFPNECFMKRNLTRNLQLAKVE